MIPWDKKRFFKKMKIFQHIGNYNQLCVNNLNADSVNTFFVNVGKNPSSVLPTHVEPKLKIRVVHPFSLETQVLLKLLDVLIALRRVNLKTLWV